MRGAQSESMMRGAQSESMMRGAQSESIMRGAQSEFMMRSAQSTGVGSVPVFLPALSVGGLKCDRATYPVTVWSL